MKLFNIICNTYAVRVVNGETKFCLERTTATGCDSLSEVKQEMRNRYNKYFNPMPSGRLWDIKTARPFCGDSYSHLIFDMPVPAGAEDIVRERREFYITKAII